MNLEGVKIQMLANKYPQMNAQLSSCCSFWRFKKKSCGFYLKIYLDISEGFYFRIVDSSGKMTNTMYDYAYDNSALAKSAHCVMYLDPAATVSVKDFKQMAYRALDPYFDLIADVKKILGL